MITLHLACDAPDCKATIGPYSCARSTEHLFTSLRDLIEHAAKAGWYADAKACFCPECGKQPKADDRNRKRRRAFSAAAE